MCGRRDGWKASGTGKTVQYSLPLKAASRVETTQFASMSMPESSPSESSAPATFGALHYNNMEMNSFQMWGQGCTGGVALGYVKDVEYKQAI